LKVLVLSQWFPPEKAVMVPDIAIGLRNRGHEVRVLTGFPNYPLGRIFDGWRQRPWMPDEYEGVPVLRVALYPNHDRSAVRRALSYASFAASSTIFGWPQLRWADVVYVYHPPLTAAAGPWLNCRLGGAPFVLHVQDLWPESVLQSGLVRQGGRAWWIAGFERLCAKAYIAASQVISIAPTMSETLVARGVSPDVATVVLNWADEEIFRPSPAPPGSRERLGIPPNAFVVMFAGNLGEVQGLEVAVEAAAQVRDLPDFRLVFVGDGVAYERLRELAERRGADNVVFVPPRPVTEMNVVNASANVHLVCLRPLGFLRGTVPSKLGSILASGLPVITSVDGDARAIAEASGAAWSVAAGSEAELASAFRRAYASSVEERQRMGRDGRDWYAAHLSRAAGIAQVESVLVQASSTRGAAALRPARGRRGGGEEGQ